MAPVAPSDVSSHKHPSTQHRSDLLITIVWRFHLRKRYHAVLTCAREGPQGALNMPMADRLSPRSLKDALEPLGSITRAWFASAYPAGPTPAQILAWQAITQGESLLLSSPTGTGKTLAAFLAIVDALLREHAAGCLQDRLRCVYVSPLRSLGYDIETNLIEPLQAIAASLGQPRSPVRIGVRTGDTPPAERKRLRDQPPHLLITTPESLSLLLAQPAWLPHWSTVNHIIIDEIHSLIPTKRGADLALSLERLAQHAARDPLRIGLSATCGNLDPVAQFLMGANRSCARVEAPMPAGRTEPELHVVSLLEPGCSSPRGASYKRLLRRLRHEIERHRTTVIFANTRAFTEKITHDLKLILGDDQVAAHHSSIDARRRRATEQLLKSGSLRAVVSSTSLELGVDIGSADLAILVSPADSVARCLQRVGRSGHRLGAQTRGLLIAANAAELATSVVSASLARQRSLESLAWIEAPLDVLCQQLIAMACAGPIAIDHAYSIVRRAAPFAHLLRADFEACLDYLCGELNAPPGADPPPSHGPPVWTSPRLCRANGLLAIRSRRVQRWFWSNVGTITSEEPVRVLIHDGSGAAAGAVGSLEGEYAERLQPGDRFLLDGRAMAFERREGALVIARAVGGESHLPRWISDRGSLSPHLASALARFREQSGSLLLDGLNSLVHFLTHEHGLDPETARHLAAHFEAQARLSEIPPARGLLIEEFPELAHRVYAFHAPLPRAACEALLRGIAARLGWIQGRDLEVACHDLGWSIRVPGETRITPDHLPRLLDPEGFLDDVLCGLDHGELLARRFRHVAATGFMVLRSAARRQARVGGSLWVSQRLYPLVSRACPDHPLLRETRREVLENVLDARTALAWLDSRPTVRLRALDAPSPFAVDWLQSRSAEALHFESPADALRRLHQRLMTLAPQTSESAHG
jgi:ATP-dependent Lhr-like helicase